jgi:hypothetical protein
MPRVRFPTWTTAAALAGPLCLLAAPAAAVAGGFLTPDGGRVLPDESVMVSWRMPLPAGRGRDEMELVLSLDDGATFPVRVTGRIRPDATSVEWRVPSLPTRHARLALRAGEDEAEESEEILLLGEAFEIGTSPSNGLEELFAVAGEWRTRDALEGAPVRPLPGAIESRAADPEVLPTDAGANESETSPVESHARPEGDTRPNAEPKPRPAPRHVQATPLASPLPLRL